MILLGVGRVGAALSRMAGPCVGTTRDPARFAALSALGVTPALAASADITNLTQGHDVVASFPPDPATDDAWSGACAARRLVYVSSTGVYRGGRVDERTVADAVTPRAIARRTAEEAWRARGAMVVRAAAIYGSGFGLHERVRRGVHAMPGPGDNVISRVHVDDLAAIIVAALARGRPGATYLAADLHPARHVDAVALIVARLRAPTPPSVPATDVAETLRGSREIDPRATLRELGVTLRYPSYRDGLAACLDAAPDAPDV
ncbi:MAG: hypothetical protein IT374_20125 [Polyangiaceae bacterium]|nr:hypothetical protein [Polyangiaceae bacterium]